MQRQFSAAGSSGVFINPDIVVPVRVVKLAHTDTGHPSQWEGWTDTNHLILVRFRYGHLWIGLTPDFMTTPVTFLATGYGSVEDGYLTGACAAVGSLVVVSLGTAIEARELTPDEIAGALAGQIERLVIDRYQREHPHEIPTAPASESEPKPPVATWRAVTVEAAPEATLYPENLTNIRTVREHVAELRKGLPIPAAGPSKNGTHSEPTPAS